MKKTTFRNLTNLILANIIIAILIAVRYFLYLPELPEELLAQLFLVSSLISQMALLTLLIALPCYLLVLIPHKLNRLVISTYLAIYVGVLLIDTQVFSQYKFHLNPAILNLIMGGQIVDFPLSAWLMALLVFAGLIAIQYFLLNKALNKKSNKPIFILSFTSIFLLSLATHGIHIWASANVYQPVTSLRPYLPAFYPATAIGFMRKQGWINEEKIAEQKALATKRKSILNYPRAEITTKEIANPKNIMFIVFDSWRYDSFNEENTPNLWQAATKGKVFNNHYAAGNSTTTGIFGLFYGLHGTYWHHFLNNQKPPLFITRLQELNYNLGIFASAQLYRPEFNSTVFATVPNLRLETQGNTPAERDKVAINDWLTWHNQQTNSNPKFSFIFLDAAHGYDIPNDNQFKKYQPEQAINYIKINNSTNNLPILNRYKNSIYYMDYLIGKVLQRLEESNELENTLIIVTGDHGQEVNDTKQNNWGHNSNFTDFQVKVPFIIINSDYNLDSLSSDSITHHIDIAPTLLKDYLGITNPSKDFSNGFNLSEYTTPRSWVISSSYNEFAIITQDMIYEIDPEGYSELFDKQNKPIKDKNKRIEPSIIQSTLKEITEFYN